MISNFVSGGAILEDQDLCGNTDPVMIESGGSPTGGNGGVVVYEWDSRVKDGAGGWGPWTIIAGATDETYDPPVLTEQTQVRRKARRSPCPEWLISNFVTLTPASTPSVSIDNFQTVCPGQPYSDVVNTNDNNLILPTYSIYSNPSNGTVNIFDDGSFYYEPNNTFCGKDQFIYEVCNLSLIHI